MWFSGMQKNDIIKRNVVILKIYFGLSHWEIARNSNISREAFEGICKRIFDVKEWWEYEKIGKKHHTERNGN